VRNNILAFSQQEQVRGTNQKKAGDHLSFTFERNIVYFDQGELFGRPWQWARCSKVDLKNNIYWRTDGKDLGFAGKSWDQWRAMGRDKEGSVIADPKFVDPENYDFRFASDEVIKQTGFQPFDYSQGRGLRRCGLDRPGEVSSAVAATGTRPAGGTQAADLQRGKTGASESAPGDRRPPINQVYPPEAFYHVGRGGRILDVTKPPFNAKGDGVTDDTKALIAALRFVRDNYEIHQGDDYSYCTKRHDRNWVVYLPDGEYLISDTVSQGWPALAMNILKGWDSLSSISGSHRRSTSGN
jgi:hypothetical protein